MRKMKGRRTMADYSLGMATDEENRFTNKIDLRFSLMSFRLKRRYEVEVPPTHNLGNALQSVTNLENGQQAAPALGRRLLFQSAPIVYVVLFLIVSMVQILITIAVARHYALNYFVGSTFMPSAGGVSKDPAAAPPSHDHL